MKTLKCRVWPHGGYEITLLFFLATVVAVGCKRLEVGSLKTDTDSELPASETLNASYVGSCGSSDVLIADAGSVDQGSTQFALQDDTTAVAPGQSILQSKCARCHTGDGSGVSAFLFTPNNPQQLFESRQDILAAIRSGDMPQTGSRLNDTEITTIANYLNGLQQNNARNFISDIDQLSCIAEDLRKLPVNHRSFARYFTLAHLYNAGVPEVDLQSQRDALAKMVNSLSWNQALTRPKPIDPHSVIFRIDVRSYFWHAQQGQNNGDKWRLIQEASPYRLHAGSPNLASANDLANLVVRGDWFVKAASAPAPNLALTAQPLYDKLLGLPQNLADLERRLLPQTTSKDNILQGIAARAGFTNSGVSDHNRIIERHPTEVGGGYYWKSYDFQGSAGVRNAMNKPLGPQGTFSEHANLAFNHDGGEMIFSLPNGLQAYAIVDSQDRLIHSAPNSVVTDPRRPDGVVVNGLSCIGCHFDGIKSKADQIGSFNSSTADPSGSIIRNLYRMRQGDDSFQFFQRDRQAFTAAITNADLGLQMVEGPLQEPVTKAVLAFEANLNRQQAAAEFGLTLAEFRTKVEQNGNTLSASIRGLANAEGGGIARDAFQEEFQAAFTSLRQSPGTTTNPNQPTATPTPRPAPTPIPFARCTVYYRFTAQEQVGTAAQWSSDQTHAIITTHRDTGSPIFTDGAGEKSISFGPSDTRKDLDTSGSVRYVYVAYNPRNCHGHFQPSPRTVSTYQNQTFFMGDTVADGFYYRVYAVQPRYFSSFVAHTSVNATGLYLERVRCGTNLATRQSSMPACN